MLLDGWSTPFLFQEFFLFYEAFCQSKDIDLDQPRPYRDYIAWLRDQDLTEAERFWTRTLRGFTATTQLGGEIISASSAAKPAAFAEQNLHLSADTTSALYAFTRRYQVTVHTIMQGAWSLLLSRYSGEQDVVFGMIVSGRPPELKEADTIVGLFVNTLPVRIAVSEESRLLPWLKQIQQEQAEARQYEYSPLVEIQRWSEVPRGMPLFNSILAFANYPTQSSAPRHDRTLEVHNIESVERTNYSITVGVIPGTEMLLKIVYDVRRFLPDTIGQMLDSFRDALESILLRPEQRLGDVSLHAETQGHFLESPSADRAGDDIEQFKF